MGGPFVRTAPWLVALALELGGAGTAPCAEDGSPALPSPAVLERVRGIQPIEAVRREFERLALAPTLGVEYRPLLRAVLTGDDVRIRRAAAVALVATGELDDAIQAALLEGLADRGRSFPLPDDLVVEHGLALQGLRALPVWRAALRHESRTARARALVAVARLGPDAKDALPDVARLVRTPPDELTSRAIFARWRLDGDDQAAAEQLAGMLSVRRERQMNGAVSRLGEMGPAVRSAVPALIAVLKAHGDAEVLRVLGGLVEHFPESIRPAIRGMLDDPRLGGRAAAELVRIDGPTADLLPHLVRMMNAPGDQAIERHELASLLGTYGPRAADALPGLTRELRSPSGQTRINAAETLGAIGPAARAALPALRAAQEDPVVAAAAAAAVRRIDAP